MADVNVAVQVVGTDTVAAWLQAMPDKLRVRLNENITRFMIYIQSYIRINKLSGNPLNRRSGNLSESITPEVTSSESGVVGSVFVKEGPARKYGAIHEFGGTVNVPAHLRMMKTVFGEATEPYPVEVRAHTAVYPERSYVRTGVRENADRFREVVAQSLAEATKP